MSRPDPTRDPAAVLDALGAVWSPDFDAPAYFDLIDRRHGRNHGGDA